jgi:WD40 repeat protein
MKIRPGSTDVAIGADDGKLRFWMSGNSMACEYNTNTLSGVTGGVTAVSWHPGGRFLAVAQGNGLAALWGSATVAPKSWVRTTNRVVILNGNHVYAGETTTTSSIQWSSSGAYVALLVTTNTTAWVDVFAGNATDPTTWSSFPYSRWKISASTAVGTVPLTLSVSPSGQWLAITFNTTVVQIYDFSLATVSSNANLVAAANITIFHRAEQNTSVEH